MIRKSKDTSKHCIIKITDELEENDKLFKKRKSMLFIVVCMSKNWDNKGILCREVPKSQGLSYLSKYQNRQTSNTLKNKGKLVR